MTQSDLPDAYKEIIIGAALEDLRKYSPVGWYSMYGGEINGVKFGPRPWYDLTRFKAKFWRYMHEKSKPYADCCGGYC